MPIPAPHFPGRPAHTKVALARFGIQMYDPANGLEACRLALTPSPDVDDIAVDDEHIFYNAAWVNQTPEREIEAVIRETIAAYRLTNGG